ncbi:outer membrane porin, OprD family [Alteromonas aestuariivivens]|uniref:Outer membrane porin, OprD family n=1 Tax=Alteromonas aestuariivivens TaxID=1938339 RepID=A0A3D8MAW1_9ALTE|nr:OprD family outer membrane porin [Alteromonas aestuariivivens]RDV26622.1 outer membrane porin, OprD family [Alteromonas aestuariivivens]
MKREKAITLGGLMAAQLLCGSVAAAAENETDDEPNQQSDLEPLLIEGYSRKAFIDDTTLVFKPRTYYLNRDRDTNPDTAGWAVGGALEYKSGWWKDSIRLAATLYTSQKLYGPEDKDGTLLFKPGPDGFSTLGELNITYRFSEDQGVRLGRQRFELPYLGSHDIRMVPNTFEGIAVGNVSPDGFGYMAGYVDKIKRKNDDDFIHMSEAAGAEGSKKGVWFAGARYTANDGPLVSGIYQRTEDVFDTLFVKLEGPLLTEQNFKLKGYVQYTDQRSSGNELIGEFDTSLLSTKLEVSYGNVTWRAAYSTTDDSYGIQKPYGNPSNYLSVIVDDFDRAGEDAWLFGASYNFSRVGVGDLSAFANIVWGDTPDSGVNASPDETEYDLTFDYRIKEGWAERLWVRVRAAYVDQEEAQGGNDFLDFRIILNYDFNLL